ncbi:MAG: AarF/UbiB family protein [Verrucomicrobia bacterium]|nr:AarF/UbiB family protein [Verrucomicrobiota bacterium]MDA1006525.1 AarF/UbiB family protein [Verrucomicrobiota bacterium]
MSFASLPQIKRNAKRFEQIVRVMAKYGLAGWLRKSDPEFIQRFLTSAEGEKLAALPRAERVRMALTELGATFIKLGQMLSTRADLVGAELAEELSKLQSSAPADDAAVVRGIIESELGQPVEQLFAKFSDTPIASASIAQAHLATLADGSEVVLKVQHAGVEELVLNDLDILTALAGLAEKYSPELRLYQPLQTVRAFRRHLLRELDFGREEQNLLQFQEHFAEDKTVRIPRPYPELSARRVLTMERLVGISVGDGERIRAEGLDRRELAKRGVNVFLEMIFRDRFYHADPHPGNILVLPDNVIGLLDCGMVGYLDQGIRSGFEGLIEGFLLNDAELITDNALQLGTPPKDLDREELQGQLEVFMQDHLSNSLKDLDLGGALTSLMEIIRRHRITLKPGVALLIKVLVMLEGTGRLLNSDFKLAEMLAPYYKRMTQRNFSPREILRRLRRSYRDWDQFFKILPRDLVELLRQARRGTLDVHLQHRRLDSVANRLAYAMLTAALFLGSTQLWGLRIPPLLWETSVPGVAGTLLSLWLGFRLLRSIHQSGGMGKED